jgi:hypothetical protein
MGYMTEIITSEHAHTVFLNNPFLDKLSIKKDGDIPGGADWQTVHEDGSVSIQAEYTIKLAEGDVMTLRSIGVRSMRDGAGAPPHFRTSIIFAAEEHRSAMNQNLYVSTGSRDGEFVVLNLFRVD